jgi:hypothetical protein
VPVDRRDVVLAPGRPDVVLAPGRRVAIPVPAATAIRPAALAARPMAVRPVPFADVLRAPGLRAPARVAVLPAIVRASARVDGAGRAPVFVRDVVRDRVADERTERVLDRPLDRGVSRARVLRPPTVGRPGPRELTAPPRGTA